MRLHFLPRNFKRARENTSRVVPGTPIKTILWRIEWLFPQCNVRLVSERLVILQWFSPYQATWIITSPNCIITLNIINCTFVFRVPETCRLAEALSPLLDPENEVTKEHREELQYYFSAGTNGICALLRVGEMERNRYAGLRIFNFVSNRSYSIN